MLLKHPDTVAFNPALKEHRAAVRDFLKRKAWNDSPIRFSHDPQYGSVAEQVQAKLLAWYLQKEEDKLAKIPSQLQRRVAAAVVIESAGTLPATFLSVKEPA